MEWAAILFWLSLAGIIYTYAGYPLLIALLARWAGRPVHKAPYTARVSVVIAAFNEAARLPAKVRTILGCERADLVEEILIGSDGSTDDPAAALKEVPDPRVRLVEFPKRRGKPSVINDLMGLARGEIVVMMDARQAVEPGALVALLQNFADERVGVVSGELVFRAPDQPTDTAQGMDAYWRYEKFLRRREARFRSVPGATGALYAFRRPLFRPLPATLVLDDVGLPMQAVRQGYRCVFEAGAVVYDEPSRDMVQEALRKRRTLAGNAQLVGLMPWLLLPGVNPIWFEFVSHKLLRLVVPFLLVLLLGSNLMLLDGLWYRVMLSGQIAFYSWAACSAWRSGGRKSARPGGWLAIPYFFVSMNVTTVRAVMDALGGRIQVQWARK